MTSSLPIPFCTEHTAPSASTPAVALIAASVNIVLVATIPSSHAGISRASVRACTATSGQLDVAGQAQAVAVDRIDVLCGDVRRP